MILIRRLLGDVLRRKRQDEGRTLRQLAAAARISPGYLSEIERGQKEPSSELLAAICDALEARLSDVLREVSIELAAAELAAQLESERISAPVPTAPGSAPPRPPPRSRACRWPSRWRAARCAPATARPPALSPGAPRPRSAPSPAPRTSRSARYRRPGIAGGRRAPVHGLAEPAGLPGGAAGQRLRPAPPAGSTLRQQPRRAERSPVDRPPFRDPRGGDFGMPTPSVPSRPGENRMPAPPAACDHLLRTSEHSAERHR